VPFAESSCAFENVFHWKPNDPTYCSDETNRLTPSISG